MKTKHRCISTLPLLSVCAALLGGCSPSANIGTDWTPEGEKGLLTPDAPGVIGQASSEEGVKVFGHTVLDTSFMTLRPGEYVASNLPGLDNNRLSALLVPPGWTAVLFDGVNFDGDVRVFTAGSHNVDASFDDKTSSIVVYGPYTQESRVTVYKGGSYADVRDTLEAGEYAAGNLSIGNDSLSSLRIPPGWSVTLYEHGLYLGESRTYTADTVSVDSFDDRTTGIVVKRPESPWTTQAFRPIYGLNGKCVTIHGGGTIVDEQPVDLWDCWSNASNQQWRFVADSTIRDPSGKCLDVYGGNTADGTNINMYTCHGSANQKWTVRADGLIQSALGKCLGTEGQAGHAGARLVLAGCNQLRADQKFSAITMDEILDFSPQIPFPGFSGEEATAFQCINRNSEYRHGGSGFRETYQKLDNMTTVGTLQLELDLVLPSACMSMFSLSVSPTALDRVKTQLRNELTYLGNLSAYLANGRNSIGDMREIYISHLDYVAGRLSLMSNENASLKFTDTLLSMSSLGGGVYGAPLKIVKVILGLVQKEISGGAPIELQGTYVNLKYEAGRNFEKMQDKLDVLNDSIVGNWGKLQAVNTLVTVGPAQWPSGTPYREALGGVYQRQIWKTLFPTKYKIQRYSLGIDDQPGDNRAFAWYTWKNCDASFQDTRFNPTYSTLVTKSSLQVDGTVPTTLARYLFNELQMSKDDLFYGRDGWNLEVQTIGMPCPQKYEQ